MLKRTLLGKYSWINHEALIKIPPPSNVVSSTARGIFFWGSLVSWDMVVTASKPKNEKHKIDAPAIKGKTELSPLNSGAKVST
ncbi:hypothetical protein D3C80_1877200 [compost metagenome]